MTVMSCRYPLGRPLGPALRRLSLICLELAEFPVEPKSAVCRIPTVFHRGRAGVLSPSRSACIVAYMEQNELPQLASITYEERVKLLTKKGSALSAARTREAHARAELRDAVVRAAADGFSELSISKFTGVTRETVRDWLGK